MSVLVFLEQHGNDLERGALGVLAKAATLGPGEVAAMVVGAGALHALASEAGKFGAETVYVAEHDSLDPPLPQPRVDVLEAAVRTGGYDTVLFSNSVLAADVAAGLAARLDAGLNWDLVDIFEVDGALVGRRPALQDSVLIDVGWRSEPRLGLFRAGSFDPVAIGGGEPRIEAVPVQLHDHSRRATVVSQTPLTDEGPSIEDAEVVIAGGMGLGGPENFALAEELAAELHGVVGATRAVVYAGWYPQSAQIGQTGKTVSPKLYVALGISGAVQHKVGMQNSKAIVAINKDPAAPIFEFSDLAVVGDVHAIVPELIELLRQRTRS
jgi:electron transfer flavoprotein alpha subunit